MAITNLDQLMDSAMKIANSEEYDGILDSFGDGETCVLEVKIRDLKWDYIDNKVSIKSIGLLSKICDDLIDLLRVELPAITNLDDLVEYFENELTFTIEEGCICFETNLKDILELVLLSFHELLVEDFEKWKLEVSASLIAFSIAMSGSANWYSITPLLLMKNEFRDSPKMLSVLKYAQRLLLKAHSTPSFLVRSLSFEATVQINNEPEISATRLSEMKYKTDDETPLEFVIDDTYRLTTFSATSVHVQKGSFTKSFKIDELNPNDRIKMGRIADEVVKDNKRISMPLRVNAKFEGEKCRKAWVEGFGSKRDNAVPAEALFATPELFSKKGVVVKPKLPINPDQNPLIPLNES